MPTDGAAHKTASQHIADAIHSLVRAREELVRLQYSGPASGAWNAELYLRGLFAELPDEACEQEGKMPTNQPTVEEVRELLETLPDTWHSQHGYCLGQKAARVVDTLCRHYLAQAAAPQLSAGEFAGLVIQRAKQLQWFQESYVAKIVAAEHNIEVVEPKKI